MIDRRTLLAASAATVASPALAAIPVDPFEADRARMLATIDGHFAARARYPGYRWAYAENWFPYDRARWLNEVMLDAHVFDLHEQMTAFEEGEGEHRVRAQALRKFCFRFPETWGVTSHWASPEAHEPAIREAIQPLIERIKHVKARAAEHGGRLAPFLPVYPRLPVAPDTFSPVLTMSSVFGVRGIDQELAFKIVRDACCE